eukprot:jgi/Hompol1/4183/HPOL_003508-RA
MNDSEAAEATEQLRQIEALIAQQAEPDSELLELQRQLSDIVSQLTSTGPAATHLVVVVSDESDNNNNNNNNDDDCLSSDVAGVAATAAFEASGGRFALLATVVGVGHGSSGCADASMNENENESEATVVVMTPMTPATRPCADLAVCAGPDACGASHGLRVPLTAILPPWTLDYAPMLAGSAPFALARFSDGIYYLATIALLRDNDALVEFDDFPGEIHAIPFEDLIPRVSVPNRTPIVISSDISDSSDASDASGIDVSDADDSEETDEDTATGLGSSQSLAPRHLDTLADFGAWERHTKVGFVDLDLACHLFDPIQVTILPPGRGLGIELARRDAAGSKRRRRRRQGGRSGERHAKRHAPGSAASSSQTVDDMFSLINNALGQSTRPSAGDDALLSSSSSVAASRLSDQRGVSKTAQPKQQQQQQQQQPMSSHLKRVNIEESLQSVKAQLHKAQQGLERNMNDPRISKIYKEKIAQLQSYIHQLKHEDARTSNSIDRDKIKKSLTKF